MKTIAIEEHFITPMYRDKVAANEFRNFYLTSRGEQIGLRLEVPVEHREGVVEIAASSQAASPRQRCLTSSGNREHDVARNGRYCGG